MKINKILQNISKENNFIYLTVALITLLISASLVQVLQESVMEYLLHGIIISTFFVCIVSLHFDPSWSRFLKILTAIWIFTIAIKHALHINEVSVIMLGLTFIFFLGAFKSLVRQILFSGKINTNKIVGSIALFLLLGLMWAIAYLMLMEFDSNSFTGMEAMAWEMNFANSAYFSFVTLTTLGYGDISPVTPIAKVLVYLEAIIGVFYMAIVVSSLVSSSIESKVNS